MDRGTGPMRSIAVKTQDAMKKKGSMGKRAMVGASTVLFAGALLIVFIFLVYSILVSFSSAKTKDDINLLKSDTRMDQTVMMLARTESINRIIFDLTDERSKCDQLEAAIRPILDNIYNGKEYWRFRVFIDVGDKCNIYQRGKPTVQLVSKTVDINGDSKRFSEQLLPNPYSKSDKDTTIMIRLDEYNYD